MEKIKTVTTLCVPDIRETLFNFCADNFTGSKDVEPYKTDVSFLLSLGKSGLVLTPFLKL